MQNFKINVWTITSDVSYHSDNTFDSRSDLVVIAILGRNYFFGEFSLFGREKKNLEWYER
jgi:hypothetical protein